MAMHTLMMGVVCNAMIRQVSFFFYAPARMITRCLPIMSTLQSCTAKKRSRLCILAPFLLFFLFLFVLVLVVVSITIFFLTFLLFAVLAFIIFCLFVHIFLLLQLLVSDLV